MKSFKTLDDIPAKGKTVLLRADLNVPTQDGKVSDTTRIDRFVPTVKELVQKGARVVVLSHFGRPKGKEEKYSLKPIGEALQKSLGKPVTFAADCIGDVAKSAVSALKDGEVLLLENVRFYAQEEKDEPAFAKEIASLGQLYVNDAFSCAHRAHATTHGIARLLPAYAGRLMEAELDALEKALGSPTRPVVALVGGAKVSTKLDLLNNLVSRIDTLVLGGGMANTFLFAQGKDVGKSLCEKDLADTARTIMATAEKHKCKILLPVDGVMAKEFKAGVPTATKSVSSIAADEMMLDIGPDSVKAIKAVLESSKTVVWNGPMGAFETAPFDVGTTAVAKVVADLTQAKKLLSVAGGGDTVSALAQAGAEEKMTYVSAAGGAFLEWMEGKDLPGVTALMAAK